ncbi:MAG TPA: endonuclease/exonuclease/phosphatase family protein [Myxococcales bacterium LLY-WYZ-16_1]|nr:endonuclease/exonuclease/phosphatase family protein [Myxococcales bacterium LLY-WYZ-16_1]
MLRVMTFNVRYFGHQAPIRGAGSTRRGIRSIAESLASLDELPHAVALQEVETRSIRSRGSHTPGRPEETQLEALLHVLNPLLKDRPGYRAYYFPAHDYRVRRTSLYTTGLATLVREDVPVLGQAWSEVTHRRDHPIARFKQTRICAHLRIRAPDGEPVDLFNTHLSLPAFFSPRMLGNKPRMGWGRNQQYEAEALSQWVKAQRDSDRFLVMGDFNSQPGSPAYRLALRDTDGHDPFLDFAAVSEEALRSVWPTAGFLNLRMRLDHIIAGPGLRFRDFDDTHPYGDRTGRWHGLSDHVPLVGRVSGRIPRLPPTPPLLPG